VKRAFKMIYFSLKKIIINIRSDFIDRTIEQTKEEEKHLTIQYLSFFFFFFLIKKYCKKMPSRRIFKYRCGEIGCNLIIRSDKWNDHCKKKHKVLFNRGSEIKKRIIEVRDKSGNWVQYK
jgi:hypothetical protein